MLEYQGMTHIDLNKMKRRLPFDLEKLTNLVRIDNVISGVMDSCELTEDMVLYRYLESSNHYNLFKKLKVGGLYKDMGYTSTSMSKDYSKSIYNVRIEIQTRQGQKGIAMNELLGRDSSEKTEYEFILKPKTNMILVDKFIERVYYGEILNLKFKIINLN